MSKTLLAAEGLSGGYGAVFAVEDVSFQLEEGTLTALLGANGSGKTTLLKMICQQMKHQGVCRLWPGGKKRPPAGGQSSEEGLSAGAPGSEEGVSAGALGSEERPTAGALGGEEGPSGGGLVLEQLPLRQLARQVSYIPQRSGISVGLTVLDVVLMGFNPVLGLLEQPGRSQRRQAEGALEELGLAGYGQRNYLSLSEGQKQLVMLARTLIEDAGLLILDEPDSALDLANRYSIMERMQAFVKGSSRAGILSLHDPQLALELCDQLVLIRDGRCVGRLHPASDPLPRMEEALEQIYGPVTLAECLDRQGRKRRVLLWEREGAYL